MTGDLIIGTAASAGLTQAFGNFDQLKFDNSHSDSARGPNKIVMHDNGSSWRGGFGIHSGTVAYYSGDKHIWYKTGSSDSYTERMTLDGSGNLSIDGTLSASGYNKSNWDTAYNWGNHAGGYLTSETFGSSDVVFSLSGDDVTAGESITLAGGLSYSGTTLTSANDNTTYTAGTGLTLTGTSFSVTANTYATAAQGTTADAALPKAGGTMTGALTINQKNGSALNLRSTTNSQPSRITFSSDVPADQIGYIEYSHVNTASYGSGGIFLL